MLTLLCGECWAAVAGRLRDRGLGPRGALPWRRGCLPWRAATTAEAPSEERRARRDAGLAQPPSHGWLPALLQQPARGAVQLVGRFRAGALLWYLG